MKKLPALLFLILVQILSGKAQVPNNGFENLNADGTLSNWGNVYLLPISIDTNGVSISDSIVFDNYFYAPTTDAHSGSFAMEIRNAYNYTTGQGISGSVTADTDTVYSAWGGFETIPISTLPVNFEFYYKYFPAGGDSAIAQMIVYDDMGYEIGQGRIIINGTVSNYTYVNVPITYSASGVIASYYLNFNSFYSADYGSHFATYGTRFLIDDISMSTVTGIGEVSQHHFNIYPNPASSIITINNMPVINSEIEVMNSLGKCVIRVSNKNAVDISSLTNGIYILKLKDDTDTYVHKFIKE